MKNFPQTKFDISIKELTETIERFKEKPTEENKDALINAVRTAYHGGVPQIKLEVTIALALLPRGNPHGEILL